jgi:signal transduction histidine kinase
MTLRLRLVLLVSGLVSAILLGLGLYVGVALEGWAHEVIDGELHRHAELLEARLRAEHEGDDDDDDDDDRPRRGHADGAGGGPALTLDDDDDGERIDHYRVADAQGQVLLSRGFERLTVVVEPDMRGYRSVTDAEGRPWRAYTRAVARHGRAYPGGPLYLTVAARPERFDALSGRFRTGLGTALALGALLGALGAWVAAHRLSAPLRRLSSDVADIDARSLDRRVPIAGLDPELARLAGALNTTLGRLELAFAQQTGFVARASHALRTPIASILSEAEVSLRRPRTAEELRVSLEEVAHAARGAAELTDQLLALARADTASAPPQRAPVALAAVGEELRRVFEPRALAAGLRFELDVPADIHVSAERARLLELLEALLDNAVRYTPRGGALGLSARVGQSTAWVELEVWDTGLGIAEDERAAVLERFTRGRAAEQSQQPGTGLGLAIVRAIADSHGARLRLEPRAGGGTRAVLEWPAA